MKKLRLSINLLSLFFLLSGCNTEPYEQGKRLYTAYCSNCHMDDGSGLAALIPPLNNADFYRLNNDRVSCIIKYGIADTIIVNGIPFQEPMPGIDLDAIQITNLINYINTAWDNDLPVRKLADVQREIAECSQ